VNLIRLLHAFVLRPSLKAFDEAGGRGDTDVGSDEQLLELFPELIVDAGALEESGYAAEPGASGAVEGGGGLFFSLWRASEVLEQILPPGARGMTFWIIVWAWRWIKQGSSPD
jgi:hypothetical protein